MTSFLALEKVPSDFLENMAIDDVLSHFQSSNKNTDSVIPIPLLLEKPAALMREFIDLSSLVKTMHFSARL